MIKLHIYISEIPTLIGENKYGSFRRSILRLWQKADCYHYNYTIKKLIDKKIIESPLITDNDIVKHQSQKYKLDLSPRIERCQKVSNNCKQLETEKKKLISYIQKQKIEEVDKEKLLASIDNMIMANYGHHNEKTSIELYQQEEQTQLTDRQKQVRKLIAKSNVVEWYLVGKIDGLRDGDTVIEIKNRVNKLFEDLISRDNIQLQAYMNCLKLTKGELVECLNKDKIEMNIIEVDYDKDYWNKVIKKRLESVIKFFYDFVQDEKKQIYFLKHNDEEINKFLRDTILKEN